MERVLVRDLLSCLSENVTQLTFTVTFVSMETSSEEAGFLSRTE